MGPPSSSHATLGASCIAPIIITPRPFRCVPSSFHTPAPTSVLGYASSSRGDSDLRVALVATAGDPDLLVSADYPNPHCSRNGGVGMTVRHSRTGLYLFLCF